MHVINSKAPNTKLPVPPRRSITELAGKIGGAIVSAIGPKEVVQAAIDASLTPKQLVKTAEKVADDLAKHEARGAEHAAIEGRLRSTTAAPPVTKGPTAVAKSAYPNKRTAVAKTGASAKPALPKTARVIASKAAAKPETKPAETPDDGLGIPTFLDRKKQPPLTADEKARIDENKRKVTTMAVPAPKLATKAELDAKRKALGLDTKGRPAAKGKSSTSAKSGSKRASKGRYDWASAEESAAKGTIPPRLDFTANTHRYYRPLLEEVQKLVSARDLKGLESFKIKGTCTSPSMVSRWRKICLVALKAAKK